MGNPLLSPLSENPAPPDIPQPSAAQGKANPLMPGATAQQGSPQTASGQPQPSQPQLPPAPSHGQTVTALRHFSALEEELSGIMKDPDLGKSDVRSEIIDSMMRLVGEGIVTAPNAVTELSTLPDKPYEQRAWVNQHFLNVVMAQNAILAHHQMGAMTGQDVGGEDPDEADHAQIMNALTARYGTQANG